MKDPRDHQACRDRKAPQVPKASEEYQDSQDQMEIQGSRVSQEIQAVKDSQDHQDLWDPEDPKVQQDSLGRMDSQVP